MHNHWLFIGNVFTHWVSAMSGIVSLTLGIVEYFRKQKVEGVIFCVIAVLFLFVSCDLAWQDEHRNAQLAIAEKSDAYSEKNFWQAQSYEKDNALRSRDQLLAQNYTALIGEQGTANKTQQSLAELSGKILEIGKPVAQKTTVLFLDSDDKQTPRIIRWILITNEPITPVNMDVQCNRLVDAAVLEAIGTAGQMGAGPVKLAPNLMRFSISSPAWIPNGPLLAIVKYEGDSKDMLCKFQ
jgi:hypothetical protein